jgi:salicylate hydroxylase
MRHVMSYTIAGGKSFNMVLSHPETTDPSTWKQDTVLEDMKFFFEGWDFRSASYELVIVRDANRL